MPKKIDHEQRKELIFRTALEVFAEVGYRETNLSLITQRCGLSRTTVYQYFRSMADIFSYAIKFTTDLLLEKYTSEPWQQAGNPADVLQNTVTDITDNMDRYRNDISNLIKVLDKLDVDIESTIRRRTAKLHLYMCRLIRAGIKQGVMKKAKADAEVDCIFALIASYCFHLAYLPNQATRLREVLSRQIDSIRRNP